MMDDRKSKRTTLIKSRPTTPTAHPSATPSSAPSFSFFTKHKPKFRIDIRAASKGKNGTDKANPSPQPSELDYASASSALYRFRSKEEPNPPTPLSPLPLPPPIHMPYEPSSPASPSTSQSFSNTSATRKLKSLIISPNLDALLKHDEMMRQGQGIPGSSWHEAHTNPPPSPISPSDPNTPKSLQFPIQTKLPSYSPSSPHSSQFSLSTPHSPLTHRGAPVSPSSSASIYSYGNNWSPLSSPLRSGSLWEHTPDTSVASLSSIMEREPVLKSLPPPPRSTGKGNRRATVGDKNNASELRNFEVSSQSRLRSMTVPAPRLNTGLNSGSTTAIVADGSSRSVAGGKVVKEAETDFPQLTCREPDLVYDDGPVQGPSSDAKTLKRRRVGGPASRSKKHSSSSSSLESGPLVPDASASLNNNPIASSSGVSHRSSTCSASSSSDTTHQSSSDSTATITPARREMEVHSTVPMPIRLPSLPPIPPSPKHPRRFLRSSKSAYNLGHRSAPPNVYASAAEMVVQSRQSSRRARLLSAEDVLGELFRKEDALDTLRILARSGTGVTDPAEEVPLPVSPSTSRYSRSSARSRSTQGELEERVGTSFLRMALEEDSEESSASEPEEKLHTRSRTVSSIYRAVSSEVNLGQPSKRRHPYSGSYQLPPYGSNTGSSSASAKFTATSLESTASRASSSSYGLSYAHSARDTLSEREYGYVAASKMRSESKASKPQGYEENVVQGANSGDHVPRSTSQIQRQRPSEIAIIASEDGRDDTLQHPTFLKLDGLPQLPKLVPPSPLSASFDRTLGYTSPELTVLVPTKDQFTLDSEEFAYRPDRSSLATVRTKTDSEESFESSKRPGSISTLAFGNFGSRRRRSRENEIQEIPVDSDPESSNLHGYEGDYNSASAESSSEGEIDITQYYKRRASEDLQHVYHTYRGPKPAKQTRRRTVPMDLYSSGGDGEEYARYLAEVQIVDLRSRTNAETRLGMGMRSNYGKEAAPADRNTLNRTTTTTTTTTNSTDAFSTLSAFNFVEQDPWSSTEHEGDIREAEPRISISSTVYSQSYYDPYDVLPTPRSAQTFQRTEPLDSMWRDSRERNNYSELEDRVSFMELLSPTENKPPVPTTPKPDFSSNRFSRKGRSSRSLERGMPNREQGRRSTPNKISAPGSRSNSYDNDNDPTNLHNMHSLTSNTLDPLSRADLVRKSKKLAQVFGQTPSGASLLPGSSSDPLRRSFLDINPSTSRHRPHNSIAVLRKTSSEEARERVKENVERVKGKGIWPPPPVTQYMSASSGRRYSTPLTPDEFDFLSELHRREPVSIPPTDVSSSILDLSGEDDSNLIDIGDANSDRQSFIDWGDDPSPKLVKGKGAHPVELLTRSPTNSQNSSRRSSVSSLAFAAPSSYAPRNSFVPQEEDLAIALAEAAPFDDAEDMERLARQPSIVSLSSPSLMSPEERAEAARRRKREKLAKLHRFLGSRVPTGLVLGSASEDSESGLPRPSASSMGEETDLEGSSEEKRSWKKGMARVTRRRSGSESGVSSDWSDIRDRRKEDLGEDERLRMVKRAVRLEKVFGVAPPQTLYHPRGHVPHAHSTSGLIAPPPKMFRSSSTGAVDGSSASSKKGRSRPNSRELLLPKDSVDEPERDVERVVVGRPRGASLVYAHYEHSLNSLGDILDRDDRASLKELHDILTGEKDEDLAAEFFPQPSQDLAGVDTDPPGYTSGYGSGGSTRSERRRSLPARTSMVSLASVASKASGGETDGDSGDGTFQARRRRAAKLTQFFGVDYRDLVRDVLDSIENGVELERGIGRIDRAEAEDLLRKLKTIKGKRAGPLQV